MSVRSAVSKTIATVASVAATKKTPHERAAAFIARIQRARDGELTLAVKGGAIAVSFNKHRDHRQFYITAAEGSRFNALAAFDSGDYTNALVATAIVEHLLTVEGVEKKPKEEVSRC